MTLNGLLSFIFVALLFALTIGLPLGLILWHLHAKKIQKLIKKQMEDQTIKKEVETNAQKEETKDRGSKGRTDTTESRRTTVSGSGSTQIDDSANAISGVSQQYSNFSVSPLRRA